MLYRAGFLDSIMIFIAGSILVVNYSKKKIHVVLWDDLVLFLRYDDAKLTDMYLLIILTTLKHQNRRHDLDS